MSTKTTIKRIALVAVSALALGTVSSVSAIAGPLTPYISSTSTVDVDGAGAVYSATALTGITSTNAPGVSFSAGLITGSVSSLTVPASTSVVLTVADNGAAGFTAGDIVNVALNGQPYAAVVAVLGPTASVTLTAPATAGTYSGVVSMTGAPSIPFTLAVGTAAGILNYMTSKVYVGAPVAADIAADAAISASATANPATAVAQITVHQFSDALALTRTANLQTAGVTAMITGAGAIGLNAGARGSYVAITAGAPTGSLAVPAVAGVSNFYVYPDSRTGKATITISVNGVVASTKTVTFTGATASIKQDVTVAPKTYIGVNTNNTDTLTFNGLDANGNVSEVNPAAVDYAISSDATVASVSASNGVVTVTGHKAGTATITVCDTASCVTPTLSATTKVTVTGSTLGKVALAFDSSSYEPGAKMTLTATVTDAAGLPLADGTYDLFGTVPTANINLAGWAALSAGGADVVVAGGVATWTFYAPFTSGNVVVSGTDSLTAANALTATATVSGPTDAAIDAANEATDAANAATDAANAAAEAADAATAAAQDAQAAVAELATQVAALMASIKAQITSLTNLVVKIQKKVKA